MFRSSRKPFVPRVCRVIDAQPAPEQTLAVLLGASIYRYAPGLAHGPAFYNSSQQFGQYLTDTMCVPEENVMSFFDESRSAGDQLRDIRNFLERRIAQLKNRGTPARDLIVHYVGHGLFSGIHSSSDSHFCYVPSKIPHTRLLLFWGGLRAVSVGSSQRSAGEVSRGTGRRKPTTRNQFAVFRERQGSVCGSQRSGTHDVLR